MRIGSAIKGVPRCCCIGVAHHEVDIACGLEVAWWHRANGNNTGARIEDDPSTPTKADPLWKGR